MSIGYNYTRVWRATLVAILLTLGGCTNFGPVRDFAAESKKLGTTFRSMPALAVEVCRADQTMGQQVLGAGIPFSLQALNRRADRVCGPQAAAEADILPFAQLLENYGDALTALADQQLPNYKVELDELQASALKLKGDDGLPVLSEARAQAMLSLAKFLGRIATERIARNEIRNLLSEQEGVQAATVALSWYATRIYRTQLATYSLHIAATSSGRLPAFEKTEPLAARSMMIALSKERQRVDELVKAADTFVSAASKLNPSRAEVLVRLDQPSDKEALTQLLALAKKIRELRKQLRALDR